VLALVLAWIRCAGNLHGHFNKLPKLSSPCTTQTAPSTPRHARRRSRGPSCLGRDCFLFSLIFIFDRNFYFILFLFCLISSFSATQPGRATNSGIHGCELGDTTSGDNITPAVLLRVPLTPNCLRNEI
jgi:hypothetical protein